MGAHLTPHRTPCEGLRAAVGHCKNPCNMSRSNIPASLLLPMGPMLSPKHTVEKDSAPRTVSVSLPLPLRDLPAVSSFQHFWQAAGTPFRSQRTQKCPKKSDLQIRSISGVCNRSHHQGLHSQKCKWAITLS